MDIAPLLDGMSGEKAVFPNVVDSLRKDGHVYTVPCRIQLPYICGKKDDLIKMTCLSDAADEMKLMRDNDPDAYFMSVPSAKGIMRIFSPACVPTWRTEEGVQTWEGDKSMEEVMGEIESRLGITALRKERLPTFSLICYNLTMVSANRGKAAKRGKYGEKSEL